MLVEEDFQLGLPFEPENIEDVYVDQAFQSSYESFCSYTPYGIKQIDSMFCRRILNLILSQEEILEDILKSSNNKTFYDSPYGTFTAEDLRKDWIEEQKEIYLNDNEKKLENDILCNQHLHPYIKQNLMINLNNYKSQQII